MDNETMESREHFGIVGGGLLGLTLALRLAQRGYRVTLLEAADHVGGLADAWQLDGVSSEKVTWDRHYHVTLLSDSHLRGILRELGLDDSMRWVKTQTGFLVDGQLHSMSNVFEFLRFPPLGLIDKLRLGWTIWYGSKLRDGRKLEQIPVADWLTRHSGRRTFERIWLPLLKAKLGEAWQRTSAAFIWATIQRMYAARHSGHKHEMFGYLPGGYARTLAAFRQRLEELGVEIRTGCRVENIGSNDAGTIDISLHGGECASFGRVVVTTPAPVAARVCTQLTKDEADQLRSVEYAGILCASLLLKKRLAGYYVTNITDPAPFTGVIEMTAMVDPVEFGGRTLVYLPKYVTADDPAWDKSNDEIRSEFVDALSHLYPHFSADDVLAFRLSRVRHVFALSTLDYSSRVPPTATSVAGLFLVNSAQIVNSTLNVNETVRLAEASLEALCQPLPRGTDHQSVERHRTRLLQKNPSPSTLITNAAAHRELVARPR
jgi:protoporphyrinogen oxidase